MSVSAARRRTAWTIVAALVVGTGYTFHLGQGPTAHTALQVLRVELVLHAAIGALAVALAYGGGVRIRALVGAAPREPRAWAWVAAAVPLLAFNVTLLYAGAWALSWVAPDFIVSTLLVPDPAPDGGRLGAAIETVGAVLLAPVVEELLFRGALLHRWERRWGARRAALATSALFAVAHFDPVGAFVFALFMCALARRTGTLLVPMAAHALFNGTLSVLDALQGDSSQPTSLAEFRAEAVWVVPAVVPSALVVTALYMRLRNGGPLLRSGFGWMGRAVQRDN